MKDYERGRVSMKKLNKAIADQPTESWRHRDIEHQGRLPEWEVKRIMELKIEQYFERKREEEDDDAAKNSR